jgi:tetratricopeptide (TPR) repeat protein
VVLIHDGLGSIYYDEHQLTKAEPEFKKAVTILRRQPEHSHALAMTLTNFSAALCSDGRCQEASALLSEASKLVKKNAIEDSQLQVHITDVSATVYLHEKHFKKAEALFLEALRMSSLPENAAIPEAADVSSNLATLYAAKGNYPKAVSSYTRAVELAEKRFGANNPNIVTILDNLGFAYIHIGRYDEAESQFVRGVAILELNGLMAGPMGISALYGLALTSVERNQLDRAQSLLARAVEAGRTIRARTPEMAETLELYSTVLRRLSRSSEAENLHSEAVLIRTERALTTRAGQ